eukprot:GEMP01016125.1.p1 GENE.GEMP01016125.1~~GEMP01016125.1.p1  ORF type:complete len:273 (+),score=44.31 GEMP01016125.1:227-1045(+)
MTKWSESSGGAESRSVFLNVYDLHWTVTALNGFLDAAGAGLGAFHVGVQVYGVEFMFANCSCEDSPLFSDGIIRHFPKSHSVHVFREAIDLGPTELSPYEVVRAIDAMKGEWSASTYSFVTKNCIHFACALAAALGATPVPERIVGGCGVLESVAGIFGTILPLASIPPSAGTVVSMRNAAVIDNTSSKPSNDADLTRVTIASTSGDDETEVEVVAASCGEARSGADGRMEAAVKGDERDSAASLEGSGNICVLGDENCGERRPQESGRDKP